MTSLELESLCTTLQNSRSLYFYIKRLLPQYFYKYYANTPVFKTGRQSEIHSNVIQKHFQYSSFQKTNSKSRTHKFTHLWRCLTSFIALMLISSGFHTFQISTAIPAKVVSTHKIENKSTDLFVRSKSLPINPAPRMIILLADFSHWLLVLFLVTSEFYFAITRFVIIFSLFFCRFWKSINLEDQQNFFTLRN